MPISFFKKEWMKACDAFNEAYGERTVCSIKYRSALIISIGWLGVLANRIDAAASPDHVRDLIKEFMRRKGIIEEFLKQEIKERREYDARIRRAQESNHRSGQMSALRERVPDHPVKGFG